MNKNFILNQFNFLNSQKLTFAQLASRDFERSMLFQASAVSAYCAESPPAVWTDENETSTIPIIALKNLMSELLMKKETELDDLGVGTATLKQLEDSDNLSLI